MKKTLKNILMPIIALLSVVLIAGCGNIEKKVAFQEYCESYRADQMTMKSFVSTANTLQKETNYKAFLSGLDTELGYLDTLIKSGENRNATITDPEIKDIDDSYLQAMKDLKDSYKMMYEGINEQDQKKLDLGQKKAESSLGNIKDYVNKLDAFAKKYNLGGDEELQKMKDMVNGL